MRGSWRMLAFCAGLAACTRGQVAPSSAPEPLVARGPVAAHDVDADGFVDEIDGCPGEPGVAPNGCPLRDRDADGFVDEADKCVDDPGVAPDGCPPPDVDGDRLIDAQDPCPDLGETRNGYQDGDGCPDEIPKDLVKFTGRIAGLEFEFDKDILRREAQPVLRRAAVVLGKYPEVRIEISGHTSSTGSPELNRELSRRRAEAVKRELVARGVAADRIETRGAGPDEPYGDCNSCTESARRKARRIEFTLLVE